MYVYVWGKFNIQNKTQQSKTLCLLLSAWSAVSSVVVAGGWRRNFWLITLTIILRKFSWEVLVFYIVCSVNINSNEDNAVSIVIPLSEHEKSGLLACCDLDLVIGDSLFATLNYHLM